MNWSSYDLPKVLKDRGVDDPEKLPNFHYRDDALKLWHAIKGYITKILKFYYHSDEDIQQVSNEKGWEAGETGLKYVTMPITNGLLQMGLKLEVQGSGDGRIGPPTPTHPPPRLSFLNKGHTYHLTTQDMLLTLCTSFDANQLTPIDHNFFPTGHRAASVDT